MASGTRRSPIWCLVFRSSAMTSAAMARRILRRGTTPWRSLGRDALALADALGIRRFAFCGLSLGGMIGQWLGANAPDRVTHLVLANTSAPSRRFGPMEQRRQVVLRDGMGAVAASVMGRFFLPESMAGLPAAASTRRTLLATNPIGYAGCCAAVRDMDHTGLLGDIRAPALLIAGDYDQSTPWAGNGDAIAAAMPGARAVHLPTAHLSNLERPREFTAALLDFLAAA